MFIFPKNFYCDIRIEKNISTFIVYQMNDLKQKKLRETIGAFIRLFDGKKWYYSAVSDREQIQSEIDSLALLAEENENIENNPIVKKFEVNKGEFFKFKKSYVSDIPSEKKHSLLLHYMDIVKNNSLVKSWQAFYIDETVIKEFYSSKGADLKFDFQQAGVMVGFNMNYNKQNFSEAFINASNFFEELSGAEEKCKKHLSKCKNFIKNAEPVKPGKYTVVLSPLAAGVFAHESFGHKSEADFMIGDETMKKEWAIGKKVGSKFLSIVDDGLEMGTGYISFDDEGTKPVKTYLIEDGILKGRLHSGVTSAALNEDLTGNARSINFEYEPIVRMTNTYILPKPGKSKDDLIKEVKDGIYVDGLKHGSGLSTFTMAPSISYKIKNGKIAEPVNISVITGNVFETLGDIDGISDKLELTQFVGGGCGKFEQFGLAVGFGGPHVRVKNMNVQ